MKKRPRILMVGNFFPSQAKSVQVCEELSRRLSERGALVVTTSNRMSRVLRLLDTVATVWLRRSEFDLGVVDVFSGPSFYWAATAGWLLEKLGKPFVYVLHGGGLPRYSRSRPKLICRVLRKAREVVAPSYFLAEGMSPYREDITVIPNGIEIEKYAYRLREDATPSLIWLRAFHRIYDPAMAARVLKEVRVRFPEAHLTMAGPEKDGSLQGAIRVAEEEGVRQAIDFAGVVRKESVPEVMNRGDVFINTTTVDNTPVSVLEAMACGLCVVSTNVGGIPYLLGDEVDALLVPPEDPKAMAQAVQRILTEPGLAERLSRNARAKAEKFDWSMILPQWEELLREVSTCA